VIGFGDDFAMRIRGSLLHRSQQHHRRLLAIGLGLEFRTDLAEVGTIEFQIEHDQIGLLSSRHFGRTVNAGCTKSSNSSLFEGRFQDFASLFGTIDDQDTG